MAQPQLWLDAGYAVALLVGLLIWWRGRHWRWIGALLAGLCWASLHAAAVLDSQVRPAEEAREYHVRGRVADLPVHEPRRSVFLFEVDAAGGDSHDAPLAGKRLRLSWYDDFGARQPGRRLELQAGARWDIRIKVRAPRGLVNPGYFDSERSMLAAGVAATGYVRQPGLAKRVSAPAGIDAWREAMADRMTMAVPSPASRFVRALALGDVRGLADADWEVLRAAGLTHLIAISGFHVGLVAGAFALLIGAIWRSFPPLLRWLPLPQVLGIAALLGAAGYAAVAGFGLPTLRTVLMLAVVVTARLARRPIAVGEALLWAMAVLLLVLPLSVLSPGFWLSFAGVAWLAWSLPGGQQHWLKGFLSAQAVATIGLLPLTVVMFGQASLAGWLANLIAIPWWSLVIVPLTLLGTALEGLHAGAGAWAWRAAAWLFEPSWSLFEWLAATPFALWWLPEPRWYALPLALLAGFWWVLPRGMPGKGLALLLWLPLLWPERELPAAGEAELVVLDVGQGLAVLVRTANHALLYDAGPASPEGYDAGERVVVPTLRALGVRRLDRLVVSHGDQDHAGGVAAVIRVHPAVLTLGPRDVPVQVQSNCEAGQAWTWEGVRFRFLHPTPYFPYLRNESSCVLRVETRHGSVLLTGDIGEVIEQGLLRREPHGIRADVVFAAHHGSAGGSSPAFVRASQARLVLVSSGHGNRFGHPRPDVIQRWRQSGAEALDTAESGALRVWLEAGGLAVREQRHHRRRLWDATQRRQQVQSLQPAGGDESPAAH